MRGFKLILTPPVTSGGGAIARRPDGRQSEKHRIKGGGAIACGLLLTCVYGCRVHVISCVFLYPIMHPVRIQAKIVQSDGEAYFIVTLPPIFGTLLWRRGVVSLSSPSGADD